MTLPEKYRTQFELLKNLFGEHQVEQKLERLEKIYSYCKSKWLTNLERFSGTPVKYLLIAEAPPWTEEPNRIKYFYALDENDEHIKFSVLLRALWKCFFDMQPRKDMLNQLAKQGFLLVDTIPFAMDYKGKRGNQKYDALVNSCADYLESQLKNPNIVWVDNVKVAFAFKVNAKAVIDSFPDGITLPTGQRINLDESMIAANGAGYPDANLLKEVFGLDD